MAIAQLVAQGHIDRHIQNRAVRETIELIPHDRGTIGWNQVSRTNFTRNGDIVTKVNLGLRVGTAPEGYRWKRCWPLYFVKKFSLEIGGGTVFQTNSETLRMKYLIDGLQTYPDTGSVIPNTTPQITQTPPECLFDFSEQERTRLSTRPHEVLFEPLCLSELIRMEHKIPLICLAFHNVTIVLETSGIEDCLEPIGQERLALPANRNALIQKSSLTGLYTYLDTEERRALAMSSPSTITKHYSHSAEIFEKPADGPLRVHVRACTNTSAAYIWITDEHNNELPSQVLDKLGVFFNSHLREEITGFHSRMGVRQLLPHPTLPNTKSQNLYYISYYPGRHDENGFEQGMHFGRIDNSRLDFTFYPDAPQRMKIHLVHREQNELRFMSGMAGLYYSGDSLEISREPYRNRSIPRRHPAPAFENTDQLIEISAEEKKCMITWNDFVEGEAVQQCLACRKIIGSEALDNWLRQRPHNKKCIHCQGPYSVTTFRKGRAHLTFEVTVGEQEQEEEQPLVRGRALPERHLYGREAQPPQPPQGILNWIFSWFGAGNTQVHPVGTGGSRRHLRDN